MCMHSFISKGKKDQTPQIQLQSTGTSHAEKVAAQTSNLPPNWTVGGTCGQPCIWRNVQLLSLTGI